MIPLDRIPDGRGCAVGWWLDGMVWVRLPDMSEDGFETEDVGDDGSLVIAGQTFQLRGWVRVPL